MEMKKLLLKGSLLLGSAFLLAACGNDEPEVDTTEETTVVESVEEVEETEVVETTEESVEVETSEEESSDAETSEEESSDAETSEDSSETESAEGLVDGEYTAVSNEDENGWSVLHTITVEDGEVTVSNFDYVNAEGDLKSEDEEYNTMMEENSGVSAADAMEELNAAFVESQSSDVDVVTGATSTSQSFSISAAALLDAAAEGNTDEINIDELGGDLQDGEYTLTTEADERGWAHQFTIIVADGEITESNYDMVNEAGDLKSEDEEYNTAMEEGTGTSFATATEELNAALVEAQSVEGIEVVSGATSTSNAFLEYAQQLLDAAAEGNTDPIEAELVE